MIRELLAAGVPVEAPDLNGMTPTLAGRYFQVIYVPAEDPNSVFVDTKYELRDSAEKAHRRRQRRKPR